MGLSKNHRNNRWFIGVVIQFSNGADLQNVLKLFEALVDGRLSGLPSIAMVNQSSEKIIY